MLFLSCHLPYPPVSGGRLREHELLTRIGLSFDVDLVVVSKTPREDFANADLMRAHCSSVTVFPANPPADDEGDDPLLPELVRRHWCPAARTHLQNVLLTHPPDVVHVEGFYLMHLLPDPCPVPVVLVDQNIEYTLCQQRLHRRLGRWERRRRITQWGSTLAAEIDAWKRSAICGGVTMEDVETIRSAAPMLDVGYFPNGADHLSAAPSAEDRSRRPEADRPTVAFIANFAYAPNIDAAEFLCREIFPRVRAAVPDAMLLLVGNEPSETVSNLAGDGVIVTGRVPSVEPYLDAAHVVVCPLREGGGVKVKVVEALARGKPIVTTSIGAQGLSPGGDHFVVEDRPRRFARHVVRLLRDEAERRALGERAARFARSLPTWDDAAAHVVACYRELAPVVRRETGA
ncbi:MAG: glycosyltransferase family 4 protein [Actinomycetota bacterium]